MRVLSWNLWGLPAWGDVARLVRDEDVDVVALQEAHKNYSARSDWADVAAEVEEALGWGCVFAPAMDLPDEHSRRQLGNLIASHLPLTDVRSWRLPAAMPWDGRSWETEPRVLLECVAGARIRVATTHLAHSEGNATSPTRVLQVDRIVEVLGLPAERLVLTGDFNATPDTPEIRLLRQFLATADPSEARTWPVKAERDDGGVDDANPAVTIDYVLHSPDLACRSFEILRGERSDHPPLIATFA